MAATWDQELKAFQVEIDIRAFAVDLGNAPDREEIWRGTSVERKFRRMQDAPTHLYLVHERGIPRGLLGGERLAGRGDG